MSRESPYYGLIARGMTMRQVEARVANHAYTQVQANTTPLGVGMTAAASIAGTTNTYANNANGSWINAASTAALDAQAGRTGGSIYFQNLPIFGFTIETGSSLAAVRHWHGVGIGPQTVDDLSAAGDWVGFRFSSTAADVSWQMVTADAANTVQVAMPTGIIPAVSTRYDLLIVQYSATQLYGYIGTGPDAVLAGPFVMAMPTGIVQTAANAMYTSIETTSAAAKAFRWSKLWYSRR